jgi:peptidoglycan/LPS O-acetylase OafA/YrhL
LVLAPEFPLPNPAPAPVPERARGRVRSALKRDLDAPSAWPVLDSLRGATVVAVVGWHMYRLTARGVTPSRVPFYFWPFGTLRLGVDVFFVLSGFLVIRSWKSARAKAGSTARGMYDYVRRRMRRILPAYWVSLGVLLVLTAHSVFRSPRHLLMFFTLSEYLRFSMPAQVNVVYWSLTVEWYFYLLVPLLAWLMVRVGRWPMLLGCVFLSFMWWAHKPPMQLPQGFVFGHLDQFVAGAIVGELVVANSAGARSAIVRFVRRPVVGLGIVFAMLSVGAYHGSTMGMSRRNGFDPFLHPVFGLLAAALILHLLTTSRHAWLEHRSLRVLGLVSFSLYLWHWPILSRGVPWALRFSPLPTAIWLPMVILAFATLVLAVATLSYLVVERPFAAKKAGSRALKPSGKPGRALDSARAR